VNGSTSARPAGDDSGRTGRGMLNRSVVVTNPLGLHMRAAAKFAGAAQRFASSVTVRHKDRSADGKSWPALMLLVAPQGSELTLEVSGDDAPAALPVLAEVLAAPSADDGDDMPQPAT
jgi:phosphocarrier protein HPr